MEIVETIKEIYLVFYDFLYAVFQPLKELIIKLYIDNPMFKIVLAFVPAILGIAYPLIIQTVSKLNEQYNSTHIINQFKKEILHKLFYWNLIISVGLTILCFVMSLGVFVVAFISVVSLISLFFPYLSLLLKYQNGHDLFNLYFQRFTFDKYIEEREKNKNPEKIKDKILNYWHPIIDLFIYSINNKDRNLENNIRDLFIYRAFGFFRFVDQKNEEYVKYPSELYNASFDIVTTYLKVNEEFYYQRFESFIGSIFFTENYGEHAPQFLHQESYNAIWRNLVAVIEYGRTDKVLGFWQNSHQYCDFHLKIPYPDHDDNFKETKVSIEKRKKFTQNREYFIQLQTALGAYLMYKKQYSALKEAWFYTQSQPPSYVLVPQNPQSIFELFFTYLGIEFYSTTIVIRFWFKDLSFDNMNNKRDVKFVICEYLGLLFLRLYITSGYYGNHPLHGLPQIPEKQSEKREWQDNLVVFSRIIEKHLENKDLLQELGLDIITEKYCEKLNIEPPLTYIEKFAEKIKDGFQQTLQTTELSEEKTGALKSNTVSSIKNAFDDIKRISSDTDIDKENRDSISGYMEVIRGTRLLLSREAFIDNTSIHHLNADSITGQAINSEYYTHFATKLSLLPKQRKYEVPSGQIFDAVDKLNPSPDDYILISFGINIKYHKDFKGANITEPVGNENYRFNSIPIYSYNSGYSMVHNTLYLIEKSGKPMVKHRDWSEIQDLPQKTKDRWSKMTNIDSDLHIYCNITDLNSNPNLKEEYVKNGKKAEELDNMIEFDVDFLGYIWFPKDCKIIEIKETDMFKEGGSKDKIEDIKPINESTKP
ncbi:MAG: hypothetical protein RBT65_19055 [Methanolobus sp.]|nr:hypothetical protein [Methanolobus sp.]